MHYSVKFVNDADLPGSVDWVFAVTKDGETVLFVKRSRVAERALSDAWAVWEHRRARRGAAAA